MTFRTDLRYVQGRIVASPKPGTADMREKLPEYTTPDALRPGWFEGIRRTAGKLALDGTLGAAERAHTQMAQSWERLGKMRETQSPEHTQAQHLAALARTAEQTLQRNAEAADNARASIARRKSELMSEFKTHVGYNSTHAAELRDVLRNMKEADRNKAVQQAVQDGDGALLAAALDAHPLLTGIKPELQQAYTRQAMGKHFTPGLGLLDALEKADKIINDASLGMFAHVDDLTAKQLREKQAAEAEKARQAAASVWGD